MEVRNRIGTGRVKRLRDGYEESSNGEFSGQTRLPSQTVGGAITYSVNGRQYVAIAAGGGGVAGTQMSMTPEADMASGNNGIYVFALPQ